MANRIAFVKQNTKPNLTEINTADLVAEMRSFKKRIGDLRTESHQVAPGTRVFVLARKGTNDAPQLCAMIT